MAMTKPSVAICDVCWRAWVDEPSSGKGSDRWIALDALLTREQLGPDDYALSHGYCPGCTTALVEAFQARQSGYESWPVNEAGASPAEY